jgi:hypothetical protein
MTTCPWCGAKLAAGCEEVWECETAVEQWQWGMGPTLHQSAYCQGTCDGRASRDAEYLKEVTERLAAWEPVVRAALEQAQAIQNVDSDVPNEIPYWAHCKTTQQKANAIPPKHRPEVKHE